MNDGTAYLLRQLAEEKRRSNNLHSQLRLMRVSRDYWRSEAKAWQWGSKHNPSLLSTPSTDLSPTERAEASDVA